MKKISAMLVIYALCGLLAVGETSAQSGGGGRIHYSKLYNPATVETVLGQVLTLGKTISGNGRTYCETLTLKSAKGTIWVILKPETFRPETNLPLKPGDEVEITGSRVALTGKAALIAAQVKKGGSTMVLRELTGRPAWAVGDDWHTP
ncbi:MAG: DNA-binding protein [Deltaproteobacteria bacterium]|nr:DNA-binding protein [Deltaproteobacteria bacterium]